jgi:hypothetical protein
MRRLFTAVLVLGVGASFMTPKKPILLLSKPYRVGVPDKVGGASMNAVVFEHVLVKELPAAWRAKLAGEAFSASTQVTVRIEEEAKSQKRALPSVIAANSLFGMWADRNDMVDVGAHVRQLRAPRFRVNGLPSKKSA